MLPWFHGRLSFVVALWEGVAFYIGGSPKEPVPLGGNQHNSVCRQPFGAGWTVKGYRWPAGAGAPGK